MIAQDQKLTVLKVFHKEGIGKASGKPYDFYTASCVDEDANVFTFNLSDKLVESLGKDVVEAYHNEYFENAQIEFRQKGYDCSGTIIALE